MMHILKKSRYVEREKCRQAQILISRLECKVSGSMMQTVAYNNYLFAVRVLHSHTYIFFTAVYYLADASASSPLAYEVDFIFFSSVI